MEVKDRPDKIRESDELSVKSESSVDAIKFEKMLFSKIIESDWSFSTKSELFVILLFFKLRFEPKEVITCVKFNWDTTFPTKFKYLNKFIVVLN
jgi:hypothetical protein